MADKRALLVALGLALSGGGCISLFPSPITPDTGRPQQGVRPDFLTLTPIRWSRGNVIAAAISQDGMVFDRGVPIGTLRADGTVRTRDLKRALIMDQDGTVHVAPGFDVIIGNDGTAVSRVHGQPDETVTLEKVKEPRNGQPGLTVEGLDANNARTAMWILMIPDLLRLLANLEDGT